MQFKDLGLVPQLVSRLHSAGYQRPTPIQAAAIPPALAGRDVIGTAQTGTGKTAAFCLPALQEAHHNAADPAVIRTLILTPTRELAAQINDSLKRYGGGLDLWHTAIFGGVGMKRQQDELSRGVDILVATPGRLLDLMNQGFVQLDQVALFVLDEVDRMLDMGFIHDVRRVTRALPKRRQTLFFSATMPSAIRALAGKLLSKPVEVSVDPVASLVDQVEESVYFTDTKNKRQLLRHILTDPACGRTVVFTRTKHGSDRVARYLETNGKRAAAIHGNKAQNARTRALEGFRSGRIQVLVATDIAARGIDVEGVTHVINFDVPNVAETYVHRIGRTARAGSTGFALSLCDLEERKYLADIERLTARRIARVTEHPFPPLETTDPAAPQARGGEKSPGARGMRRRGARRPRYSSASS